MSRAPIACASMLALTLAACEQRDAPPASADSTTSTGLAASHPGDTPRPIVLRPRFRGVGRAATTSEVRAWNIDVNGAGVGLPPGRGGYERGTRVYAQHCASCHGAKGEGIPPSPRLVGTEPRDFSFGNDPKLVKTVGNYWPYATTLYDYINRAMPLATPGSLPPDDVYGVIAYLLAENQIIDRKQVMDARSLPRVRMPARDRFVTDDRRGGAGFR